MENKAIAEELRVGRDTAATWRPRFSEKRLACLVKDAPRGGRKPTRRARMTKRIVNTTLHSKPKDATHWSTHRAQPGLPIRKGRRATMTHDYKRNGTTTLFAALELAEGS